jgi:signal transduction histidine kinase
MAESLSSSYLAGRYRFRLLSAAVLLAALVIELLVLPLLEQNFNLSKKELIYNKKRPLDEILSRTKAINYRVMNPAIPREEMNEHLRQAFSEVEALISPPDFPAVKMELADAQGEVVYEWEPRNAQEKRRRFNTWENCLFTRNFEFVGRGKVLSYEFRVYFVSWPGIPEVHDLVILYRCYAALFTLANALAVFILFTGAIRPLARITRALEGHPDQPPPIIRSPRHAVERSYNTMARGTRLTSVHFGLSYLGERLGEGEMGGFGEDASFWESALSIIRQGMGYRHTLWLPSGQHGDDGRLMAAGPVERGPDDSDLPRVTDIDQAFQSIDLGDGEIVYQPSKSAGGLSARRVSEKDRPWFAGVVKRREDRAGILLASLAAGDDAPESSLVYFRAVVNQLGQILTRSLERSLALDRGRYEVSIDLSASMGHDLTNILATGKLELETLRTAFRKGIVQVPPEKQGPVMAAVEGLRKTTVLLQEVVNVYRAFSFTREPAFERVNLNTLAAEVIDLYRHSTSRQVAYKLSDTTQPVVAWADPRLLKLVLFNLLANATHAIAGRQAEQPFPPGEVDINCREEEGWAVLVVADNGTGFQDRKGERLEGVELQQVFQFDFTTKQRQGGLGLAWVRSIIVDIHQGRLVPAQRATGEGAVMSAYLPPAKESRSQEGTEPAA